MTSVLQSSSSAFLVFVSIFSLVIFCSLLVNYECPQPRHLPDSLGHSHKPVRAVACIDSCVLIKNSKHWQPYHWWDTWMQQTLGQCRYPRGRGVENSYMHTPRLQALVYDILPSTIAVFSYIIGPRKLSANKQFFCCSLNSSKFVAHVAGELKIVTCIHPNSRLWFTTSFLQPLPYLVTS